MLFVNVKKRKESLIQAIKALEYQIKIDTTEKDRKIHIETIRIYRNTLMALETNERKVMENENSLHGWKGIDCL